MKCDAIVVSVILLSAFCQSFKMSGLKRPASQNSIIGGLIHRLPEGQLEQRGTEISSIGFRRDNFKCISLSLFTGLLLFGSVVQPSVAQTLGTKVDIGKSVLCENVQLDHLVKEGAGGGGTVFSAYRRQPNSKMPEMDSTAPQVVVKVSWVTSASSVRHECEVLKYLEKYNVKGVERCIASGAYVPPTDFVLPSSTTAALPTDVFFPSDGSRAATPTATDALQDQIRTPIRREKSRKSTTYLASLYEEDEEEKQEGTGNYAKFPKGDEGRVMIVLDPFFKTSHPSKSTLQDITSKPLKLKAVHNLMSTMVDMLSAGAAGSDLQPLMDVNTGETLLIDMTEAEIFSDRKKLSFEDKQIAGSFIGEMFSLLASDKENTEELMVEARNTIEEKTRQLHDIGDDLPGCLTGIISAYTE